MKYDKDKARKWMKGTDTFLPGLYQALLEVETETLLIGAGVFELYVSQGWVPALKRKTGDIDLSIGLAGDLKVYETLIKKIKEELKFNPDEKIPYRLHSPKKIPGAMSYVDVLAHSISDEVTDDQARTVMGVGGGFSLDGMAYAIKESYHIEGSIYFPNPFGQIYLKKISYTDEPSKRSKDLADIVELISGLVETGTHFSINELWQKLKDCEESKEIKQICEHLANDSDTTWDLYNAEYNLKERQFSNEEIEETLPQRVKEFLDQIDD